MFHSPALEAGKVGVGRVVKISREEAMSKKTGGHGGPSLRKPHPTAERMPTGLRPMLKHPGKMAGYDVKQMTVVSLYIEVPDVAGSGGQMYEPEQLRALCEHTVRIAVRERDRRGGVVNPTSKDDDDLATI